MSRLLTAIGWMMVAAMLRFHKEINQFFSAHPTALWIAMGTMLAFCFGKAVQRELEKRKQGDPP